MERTSVFSFVSSIYVIGLDFIYHLPYLHVLKDYSYRSDHYIMLILLLQLHTDMVFSTVT